MKIRPEISKVIDQAIQDCSKLNDDFHWARLIVDEHNVKIEIGQIINGVRQTKLTTRDYYFQDGEVKFNVMAHP